MSSVAKQTRKGQAFSKALLACSSCEHSKGKKQLVVVAGVMWPATEES